MLGRDLVMVPKLIHPVPPTTPRTPDSGAALDEDLPQHPGSDTWMTQVSGEGALGGSINGSCFHSQGEGEGGVTL